MEEKKLLAQAKITIQNSSITIVIPIQSVSPTLQIVSNQPVWDASSNCLWLGAILIKKYNCPAANQRLVLNAFEEDGWPHRIDDPLPFHPEIEPKQRVRSTVKALNRNQLQPILLFRSDGTGTGFIWQLTLQEIPPLNDEFLPHAAI